MSSFFTTIILTTILVGLAIVGLSIGLILTGKSRIRRGGCGMVLGKKRDESCDDQPSCGICSRGAKKSKESDEEKR